MGIELEQRMRDMVQAPLCERKLLLRQLMLDFHPDKNCEHHATEVFQFINASRSWFLGEDAAAEKRLDERGFVEKQSAFARARVEARRLAAEQLVAARRQKEIEQE